VGLTGAGFCAVAGIAHVRSAQIPKNTIQLRFRIVMALLQIKTALCQKWILSPICDTRPTPAPFAVIASLDLPKYELV